MGFEEPEEHRFYSADRLLTTNTYALGISERNMACSRNELLQSFYKNEGKVPRLGTVLDGIMSHESLDKVGSYEKNGIPISSPNLLKVGIGFLI
jgi:hypothetical protein